MSHDSVGSDESPALGSVFLPSAARKPSTSSAERRFGLHRSIHHTSWVCIPFQSVSLTPEGKEVPLLLTGTPMPVPSQRFEMCL